MQRLHFFYAYQNNVMMNQRNGNNGEIGLVIPEIVVVDETYGKMFIHAHEIWKTPREGNEKSLIVKILTNICVHKNSGSK